MRIFRAGQKRFGQGGLGRRTRLVVAAAAGALAFAAGASHGASLGAETSASPVKLRFGGDSASTRVVLELSEAASAEVVSNGAADGHVILDFSKLSVGDSLDGQGRGLVKAWTIDKAHARAQVRRRFLLPPSDGVTIYRYVLDIDADGPPARGTPIRSAPKAQVAEAQT